MGNKWILAATWLILLIFGHPETGINCLIGYTVCCYIDYKFMEQDNE